MLNMDFYILEGSPVLLLVTNGKPGQQPSALNTKTIIQNY